MEEAIQCPRCGSTQVSANKKGWTVGTGLIGSSKILITCLKCGKQFRPGQDKQSREIKKAKEAEIRKKPLFWVVFGIVFVLILFMFKGCVAQSIGSQYAGGTVYRIASDHKHGSIYRIIADSVTYDQATRACDSLKGWKLSASTDWMGFNGMPGLESMKIKFPVLYYWIKSGTESSMSATAITAAGNYSMVAFSRKKSKIGLLVVKTF